MFSEKVYIYICIVFLALSCSKDLNENQTSRADQFLSRNFETTDIKYVVDLPIKGEFNVDINEIIQLSDEEDEIKLDYLLYYAADALKELIKDPAFNQKVLEEARKSPNETANVLKIADAISEVASSTNQVLQSKRSEIQDKTGVQVNSLSDIDQNLTHIHSVSGINRKYDLAIFVPNLATLDPNMQPIFSPNISVDEEKYPELPYHVIAWVYDKDGSLKQITLGEEEAMKSLNPIFIMDNASLTNLSKEKQKRKDPDSRKARSVTSFHTHEYLIGSSFEVTGNSELHVTAAAIDVNGNNLNVLHPGNQFTGSFLVHKEIDKVPGSGIGQMRTKWSQLFNLNNLQDTDACFWNVFERDWSHGEKWLGDGDANGGTIQLKGKRKFWDDVYLYDRDDSNQLQDDWFFVNSANTNYATWINGSISGITFQTRLWKVIQ